MNKNERMQRYGAIQKELNELMSYYNQVDSEITDIDYVLVDHIRINAENLSKLIRS